MGDDAEHLTANAGDAAGICVSRRWESSTEWSWCDCRRGWGQRRCHRQPGFEPRCGLCHLARWHKSTDQWKTNHSMRGVGSLDKRGCYNCSRHYLARDCKGNGPGKFKGNSKDSKDKGKDARKSKGKSIDGKGKGFDKKSEKYCSNCRRLDTQSSSVPTS